MHSMLQACPTWMAKVFTWRNTTSFVWTWCISFVTWNVYLVVWLFSPFRHIYVFYDYLLLLCSPMVWLLLICLTTSLLVSIKLYEWQYQVTARFETQRWGIISSFIHPSRFLFVLCHGALGAVMVGFSCSFSYNHFSAYSVACTADSGTYTARCFNEFSFFLFLFGLVVGISNHVMLVNNQLYTLRFPFVQQGRFLSLKCHILNILISSAKTSLLLVRYYAVLYYLFGFVLRDYIAEVLALPMSGCQVLSLFTIMDSLSALWTLWISGMLFTFLCNASLHMFNICHTEMMSFPIDSVFPEDSSKLLTSNLYGKQPSLVQHLAFQRLAFVTRYSAGARKQVFALGQNGIGTSAIKWNTVADQCLFQIADLTEKLGYYQRHCSYTTENARQASRQSSSPAEARSAIKASDSFSSPKLRRRPLRSGNTDAVPSAVEVSLNSTTFVGQSNLSSSFRNSSTLPIPTPKLWTRQYQKAAGLPSSTTPIAGQDRQAYEGDASKKAAGAQFRSVARKLWQVTKSIPVVVYFTKQMPERAAANLFSGHYLCTWALQSISFLVAASFTEDKYGVVQRRLPEIIASLLNLHTALEKHSKLAVASATRSASLLLREQRGLRAETKSAIYRIANTFADHFNAVTISSEHQRKLRAFVDHRE